MHLLFPVSVCFSVKKQKSSNQKKRRNKVKLEKEKSHISMYIPIISPTSAYYSSRNKIVYNTK